MSTETETTRESTGEIASVSSSTGEIASVPSSTLFEWKIKDYFQLPGDKDFRLCSPDFSYHGATWSMVLYPNGEKENKTNGYAGLYLRKISSLSKHYVQYRLGLKTHCGTEVWSRSTEYEFLEKSAMRGWSFIFKVQDLLDNKDKIAPDGVLTVFCKMGPNGYEGLKKLQQNFKSLFLTGEASDVTLNVKDRDFRVHYAFLLARSSAFIKEHNMKTNCSAVIKIDDYDPDVFEQYLTYLYTGNVENLSLDTIFALHTLAEKYNEEELTRICIQFMIKNLSIEIFCDVLFLLLKVNDPEILNEAVMYFAKHEEEIIVLKRWEDFIKENTLKANEIYIKAEDYNKERK